MCWRMASMMCYSLLKLMRFHKGERLTVTQRQEPATRVVLMTSTHNTQAERRRESSEDPRFSPVWISSLNPPCFIWISTHSLNSHTDTQTSGLQLNCPRESTFSMRSDAWTVNVWEVSHHMPWPFQGEEQSECNSPGCVCMKHKAAIIKA